MPLLNIGGVTGGNHTLQFCVAFLHSEKEEDYNWVMGCMQRVMEKHQILAPTTMITDRELALMNSINRFFPLSSHLLCQWHVGKNVQVKTKQFFPRPTQEDGGPGALNKQHKAFYDEWRQLLQSTFEIEFEVRLQSFKTPGKYPIKAVSYAVNTWLIWKEKLVSFWTTQTPHFGNTTTSRLEGLHAVIKAYIQSSSGDLLGVFKRLLLFWESQHQSVTQSLALQRYRRRHEANLPCFIQIREHVHDFALTLIAKEIQKLPNQAIGGVLTANCTGYTLSGLGLPCSHKLQHRIEQGEGLVIYLEDLHPHWLVTDSRLEKPLLPLPILEPLPAIVGGRKKHPTSSIASSHKRGHGENATRRLPSLFELPVSTFASAPPPSTAPPRLEGRQPLIHIVSDQQHQVSSTSLGKRRLDITGDTYEPGTDAERGYKRQIQRANQEANDDRHRLESDDNMEISTASQAEKATVSQLIDCVASWEPDEYWQV